MLKISVVIPTFNSYKFIDFCLTSVLSQGYSDLEVIVVDNGSKDATVDFIKNNFPQIIMIENYRNLGACKARNQGIEVAMGEWVLTLDCDITLEKSFFSNMINCLEGAGDDVGMFQPKIFKSDRKTIYSCGIYLSRSRRFYDIGMGRLHSEGFHKTSYIFGACSAAAWYRRLMLENIKEDTGYFDERFFFLAEDVDLAWRAQRKRWKAVFYPDAVCYHLGNSSDLEFSFRQYLCFRNRYYLILKNEGWVNYLKKIYPALFYDLPRICYLYVRNPYMRRVMRFLIDSIVR